MGDELRTAYRAACEGRTDHPSDETWERLAMDEISAGEREAVLEHVASCTECADIYRGLRILAAEAHSFDPGAPEPARTGATPIPLRRGRNLLVGAATLAAAVGLALVLRPLLGPSQDPAPVVRSSAVTQPRPVAPGPGPVSLPVVFRWQPVEGARGYVVEVFGDDGTKVWTGPETTANELGFPGDAGLVPGRYYWRVTAVSAEGRRLPSELVAITVAGTRRPGR